MRFLLICLILSIFSFNTYAQDTASIQGRRLPEVTIQDVDGNRFSSSQISNGDKPVVIVFWKTCCKPPIRELSVLNDLYEEWKQKTGVKIYAVSIDDARATGSVKPFTNGQGWEFEILLDPNQAFKRSMGVNGVPHTFVINGKGEIVGQKLLFSEGDENDIYDMVLKSSLKK